MTEALIEAARALTDVIERENAALEAVDHAAAGRLLGEKRRAAEALAAVAAEGAACGEAVARLRDSGCARLRDAARANQRLLERAIAVQERVIAIVARAIPRAAPGYGADGGFRADLRPPPMSLSARA